MQSETKLNKFSYKLHITELISITLQRYLIQYLFEDYSIIDFYYEN